MMTTAEPDTYSAEVQGIPFNGEEEKLLAQAAALNLPLWKEMPQDIDAAGFTGPVPLQFLKRHKIVPLEQHGATFIAVNDPILFESIDDLKRLLQTSDVSVVLAPESAILSAIHSLYDLAHDHDPVDAFVQTFSDESYDRILSEIEETGDLLDDAHEAPMIQLVNLILSRAIRDRASDIHIEPYQSSLKIRYRIDGMLSSAMDLPRKIHAALVSRIKIMAKLNIAEKRLPQDGRIDARIGERSVDVRVSVLPTAFGERLVLRLLDKTRTLLQFPDLGFNPQSIGAFNRLTQIPYGIILVTGPTGSGKTTTLYAMLSHLNNSTINIITIEDPIEYQIEGIAQIQVNPKIDLTFANGLRSIVRQDPDVILVGEIRDKETAEIAIQSSLTGHLVLSTLHTNDAASAVTRLIDMGIEPFLITSSVFAVVAQRLVRVLCPSCKEPYLPEKQSLANIGLPEDIAETQQFFKKAGCASCMNTGYHGRTAITEIMYMDESVKATILRTSDASSTHQEALNCGMITLLQDGVRKVKEGITTIEEVLRVTRVLRTRSRKRDASVPV
jgi:general secretion pathway protein E